MTQAQLAVTGPGDLSGLENATAMEEIGHAR
jgi:hypothetical protein